MKKLIPKNEFFGALEGTRTPDLLVRSQSLYPTELPAQNGADDEARTRYLHLGKVALYQMSYIRKCKAYYTYKNEYCQGFFFKFEKTFIFSIFFEKKY